MKTIHDPITSADHCPQCRAAMTYAYRLCSAPQCDYVVRVQHHGRVDRSTSMIMSIFSGLATVLLYGPLAPLTMMWVLGERSQGRVGVLLWNDSTNDPTIKGGFLMTFTAIFGIVYFCALGSALHRG